VIKRIAAAVGVIAFLVIAGTATSYAYWSATAGMTTTVTTADPATTNCSAITRLTNGGFETPVVSAAETWQQMSSTAVTPWVAVVPGTNTATSTELWKAGVVAGIAPVSGLQNLELNGTEPATLRQDVATVPGQTLRWSFWHRGRDSATVGDQVRLSINAAGASLVTIGTYTTTNSAWAYYTGTYTVPAGQTSTRLSLTSVGVGGGLASQGNLIDDVSFGTGPCLNATSAITNITAGGSTYRVGDTVEYTTTVTNLGGATSDASVAKITLPATLTLVPGSLKVDGVARTDAAGDDVANIASGVVVARIGAGAGASAGGKLSPYASATVTYRAVIGVGAASGTITQTPTMEYVDEAVPTWTLSRTVAAGNTPVAAAADIEVAVLAQPTITGSASATWTFRVTNNGPSNAAAFPVAVTLPSGVTFTTTSVRMSATDTGAATTNCTTTGTTRTCNLGAIPVGEGRTVSVTGTLPGSPTSLYAVTATATPATFDHVSGNNAATNTGLDGVAPNAPTGVTASRQSSSSVQVGWTAATDPAGTVAGYRIYRNGTLLNPTTLATGTSYLDSGLTANQLFWYTIVAVDNGGNASAVSAGAGAATYVTGSQNVRIVYPAGSNLCLGASGTGSGADVESRTGCTSTSASNVQWGFTSVTAANSVEIQLGSATNRKWTGATTGDINLGSVGGNANAAWRMDVQWDTTTSAPYLRLVNSSGRCATVASVTDGSNLAQNTCSTTLATQRFTLGAW